MQLSGKPLLSRLFYQKLLRSLQCKTDNALTC